MITPSYEQLQGCVLVLSFTTSISLGLLFAVALNRWIYPPK